MIFATVGTQLPFNRLIDTLDDWASTHRQESVFAQVGKMDHQPANLDWAENLTPHEFKRNLEDASLVVAHAGMGTILSALEIGKRVLVMPRLSKFGEHRNDHQLATVRKLEQMGLVDVAFSSSELMNKLSQQPVDVESAIKPVANDRLISYLGTFISQPAA